MIQSPEQQEPVNTGYNKWHLAKQVSIGNLLTSFIVVIGLIGSYMVNLKDGEHRLTVVETAQAAQEQNIDEFKAEIIKRLDRLEGKVDSLKK